MKRSEFLKLLAFSPVAGSAMNLSELHQMSEELTASPSMPALFLGHGSPMNAIEENEFVKGFREVSKTVPRPVAVLVISAHWETKGTFVTAMENPRTIHDFGGFPKALYEVQYPAPGSPEMAQAAKEIVSRAEIGLDHSWGLDHGAWSVVKHLFPNADVPVLQLSIDYTKDAKYHYELARELSSLRQKGVLIIGSGNMVHNLGIMAWDKLGTEYAYDWAEEASVKMKQFILNGDHESLIGFRSLGKAFDLAVPTPEHYLPLIYTLALKNKRDEVSLFNDKALGGSITMTSVRIAHT